MVKTLTASMMGIMLQASLFEDMAMMKSNNPMVMEQLIQQKAFQNDFKVTSKKGEWTIIQANEDKTKTGEKLVEVFKSLKTLGFVVKEE